MIQWCGGGGPAAGRLVRTARRISIWRSPACESRTDHAHLLYIETRMRRGDEPKCGGRTKKWAHSAESEVTTTGLRLGSGGNRLCVQLFGWKAEKFIAKITEKEN